MKSNEIFTRLGFLVLLITLLMTLTLGPTTAEVTDLVINGEFEDNPAGEVGPSDLPGWNTTDPYGFIIFEQGSYFPPAPQNGSDGNGTGQFLKVRYETSPTTITQSFAVPPNLKSNSATISFDAWAPPRNREPLKDSVTGSVSGVLIPLSGMGASSTSWDNISQVVNVVPGETITLTFISSSGFKHSHCIDQVSFVVDVKTNEPPVADAGDDATIFVTETHQFDGSGSSDADGDDLSYEWTITSKPAGSTATLSDPGTFDPTPTADVAGDYVLELVVNDGTDDSDPDQVTLTVLSADGAVDLLTTVIDDMNIHGGTAGALTSKLNNVLKSIDRGNSTAAVNTLGAFINSCKAQRGKKLSKAQADELIELAQRIISGINSGGLPKRIANNSGFEITPEDYVLGQNYPNPFNPTTEITFALPKAETVKLSIYNTNGQLIRTLVNGFYSEGFHTVMWNATDESGSRVTSGMYVYVLRAGETVLQNKMVDSLLNVPGTSQEPGTLSVNEVY